MKKKSVSPEHRRIEQRRTQKHLRVETGTQTVATRPLYDEEHGEADGLLGPTLTPHDCSRRVRGAGRLL